MNKFGNSLSPDEVNSNEYEIIYFAGGHGAVWDLKDNTQLNEIALDIYNNNGVISSVCHGAVGLLNIKKEEDYIVKGKNVTGFTNSEEESNGTTDYMPYLLEDEFKNIGAQFKKEEEYIVKGKNVTGFTNSEEESNGTTDYMPYLLEDEFKNIGAQFKKEEDWSEFAVTDERIVTGQNPQSGHAVAKEVLNIISKN